MNCHNIYKYKKAFVFKSKKLLNIVDGEKIHRKVTGILVLCKKQKLKLKLILAKNEEILINVSKTKIQVKKLSLHQ